MPYTALKPSQELVDIVGALGGTWHGYVASCRCPAHCDKTPSLSLRQGDQGILVTCFAGCDAEDVLREGLADVAPTGLSSYVLLDGSTVTTVAPGDLKKIAAVNVKVALDGDGPGRVRAVVLESTVRPFNP